MRTRTCRSKAYCPSGFTGLAPHLVANQVAERVPSTLSRLGRVVTVSTAVASMMPTPPTAMMLMKTVTWTG